jgi:hypothetical protein
VRWHELVRTLSAAVFSHAAQIKELARQNAELYDEGFDDSVPFKAHVSRALWNEQIMLREKASEIRSSSLLHSQRRCPNMSF